MFHCRLVVEGSNLDEIRTEAPVIILGAEKNPVAPKCTMAATELLIYRARILKVGTPGALSPLLIHCTIVLLTL